LNVSGLTDPNAACARAARTAKTVTRERISDTADQRMVRRLVQAFLETESFASAGGRCMLDRSLEPSSRGVWPVAPEYVNVRTATPLS